MNKRKRINLLQEHSDDDGEEIQVVGNPLLQCHYQQLFLGASQLMIKPYNQLQSALLLCSYRAIFLSKSFMMSIIIAPIGLTNRKVTKVIKFWYL